MASISSVQTKASVPLFKKIVGPIVQKSTQLFKSVVDPKKPTEKTESSPSTLPPTPKDVFWALGKNWWMQIIDGQFHELGPYVFDKGLHGGDTEPGYYGDALAGCMIASDNILAPPSVHLYKTIQKAACHHFDGEKASGTLIKSDKTGKFCNSNSRLCNVPKTNLYLTTTELPFLEREYEKYAPFQYVEELLQRYLTCEDPTELLKIEIEIEKYFSDSTIEDVIKESTAAFAWLKKFEIKNRRKIAKIQAEITQKSKALGLTHPIAILTLAKDCIVVSYQCTKDEVVATVEKLFKEYNQNMANATTQEEKLKLIAELFQMLEWLHPFPDGQGRTDLILLNKELCKHGFTPAILEQPYFSTSATLNDWIKYLKDGMEKWQKQESTFRHVSQETGQKV